MASCPRRARSSQRTTSNPPGVSTSGAVCTTPRAREPGPVYAVDSWGRSVGTYRSPDFVHWGPHRDSLFLPGGATQEGPQRVGRRVSRRNQRLEPGQRPARTLRNLARVAPLAGADGGPGFGRQQRRHPFPGAPHRLRLHLPGRGPRMGPRWPDPGSGLRERGGRDLHLVRNLGPGVAGAPRRRGSGHAGKGPVGLLFGPRRLDSCSLHDGSHSSPWRSKVVGQRRGSLRRRHASAGAL